MHWYENWYENAWIWNPNNISTRPNDVRLFSTCQNWGCNYEIIITGVTEYFQHREIAKKKFKIKNNTSYTEILFVEKGHLITSGDVDLVRLGTGQKSTKSTGRKVAIRCYETHYVYLNFMTHFFNISRNHFPCSIFRDIRARSSEDIYDSRTCQLV